MTVDDGDGDDGVNIQAHGNQYDVTLTAGTSAEDVAMGIVRVVPEGAVVASDDGSDVIIRFTVPDDAAPDSPGNSRDAEETTV